ASMKNLADSHAALRAYQDALNLHEQRLEYLKARFGPSHRDTLLGTASIADCLIKLKRGAEALPLINAGIERVVGQPSLPRLLANLVDLRVRCFEQAGDAAGCRATAELWEKVKGTDPGGMYDAACYWAITATVLREGTTSEEALTQAVVEADRAMGWLKKAVAAGYRDANHM